MSDDEDHELDRLAAELRLSPEARLPGELNEGGTVGSLDGRDPSALQGMSAEDTSVNLETVTDMEYESVHASHKPGLEPVSMFRASDEQKSSGSKKSRIYVVPLELKDFNQICFNLIGAGAVFCTGTNCTVSHRGGSVMSVQPGDIFVSKSSSEAFVEPRMSSLDIDDLALQDWKDASLSFEAWSEKFLMASAAGNDGPASSAAMEVQEDFYRNQALTFKTPAKRKRERDDDEDEPELATAVPYSPLFKDDEDLVLGDLSEVSGLLSRFDQSFLNMNGSLVTFMEDYKIQSKMATVAFTSIWFRIEALTRLLGSRPSALPSPYQAPSAWGSLGELASVVERVNTDLVTTTFVENLLKATEANLNAHVTEKVTNVQSTLSSKSRGLRTFVIDVARSLGRRLQTLERRPLSIPRVTEGRAKDTDREDHDSEIELRLLKLENPGNAVMMAPGTDALSRLNPKDYEGLAALTEKRIEERLTTLDVKVGKLFARGDDVSIKFSGLGFIKPPDANSWLEKELPHHPSGLIVDAHMVFERVFYNMDNTDTLARLQQCYKIKVTTIADGVAITSFDSKIPKFFSRSHGHKVVKTDGSFLDAIASYQEWDDPGTGYRLRLQEELANFEDIHGTYLEEYFAYEAGQGYAISRLALTESMGWIEGFITFIDTYYRELTKAKFGSAKAWHVTTRLAKRVLDEVGTTRQSAQGGFEAGNAVKICQNIVWAVLKAHDVMAEYKRLSFKNHPSVATELVKFLAINTSFESIDKLITQTKILETDVSELKKQVAAAAKKSDSSSNKSDQVQKQCDSLIKRIAKLEQK
jgi:hypothetical protein